MLSAWVAAFFLANPGVQSGESPFEIRVRLYNYADAQPGILEEAKANASVLLEQTGVRVVWAECWRHAEDPPIDSACQLPLTPLDLELRIINREMADRLGTSPHRLGYAWLTPGLDSIAAAYLHRANDIAQDYGIRRATALAGIMAHEIGHLLLDRSAHSATGVMRASWEYGDLLKVAQGTLWFTRPEAERIREMVKKRAESRGAELRR